MTDTKQAEKPGRPRKYTVAGYYRVTPELERRMNIATHAVRISRSDFIRNALEDAVNRTIGDISTAEEMEDKHQKFLDWLQREQER